MKFLLLLIIAFNLGSVFCQGEEVGPIISNIDLTSKNTNQKKSISNIIDSTFIFSYDTLDIPFIDEFSKNKFQQYNIQFNTPGVTSQKYYKLLDDVTLTPLPDDNLHKYSSIATYRRTYSVDHLTYTDVDLTPIIIKTATLGTYPVEYTQTTAYPPYRIIDSLGVLNDIPDTNKIDEPDITQDSANVFFYSVNDPNSLWIDNQAYHNYRYAVNPWSLGVATFDGLDENGKAYYLGSNITNYGDYLTSKPLDLSTVLPSDSIYLSFLYQSGGFGDTPESTDSLVLDFYDVDLGEWNRIWAAKGSTDLDFHLGHINIKSSKYLKKGFQFRFKNYGHLAGSYDIFNLDYVYLRKLSGHQDTLFIDYAWVYPIKTLLKDYISVPWDHYKNNFTNKMANSTELSVRNGNNIPSNNNFPATINIEYNNSLEGTFTIAGTTLSGGSLNYAPRTNYTTLHDFSSGYHFDETKAGTKQTFDIISSATPLFSSTIPDHDINDTTYSSQYFANYYAYDDGSPEAAYGPTGIQSDLAVKFTPYEADSLLGIMICFVEAAVDVSNKLFLLTVWDDNNGIPGNIIYRDEIFNPRKPEYSSNMNEFYTYFFNDGSNDSIKINITGTFYIGWQQIDQDRLNIGFDKNNINNSKTFYSVNSGSTWNSSQIPGTPMIRPLFSTTMDLELGIKNNKIELNDEILLFPNPTNGILKIQNRTNEYIGVDVYSIHGKLIESTFENEIDLTTYTNGMYLFKLKGNSNKIYKVIKN